MSFSPDILSGEGQQESKPESSGADVGHTPEYRSEPSASDYLGPFSADGIALAISNGKYMFVDRHGIPLGNDSFDWASGFERGTAWVRIGAKHFLVDKTCRPITEEGYDEHWPFVGDIARVRTGEEFAFIKRDGRVLQSGFERASDVYNGRARVERAGVPYFLYVSGELERR